MANKGAKTKKVGKKRYQFEMTSIGMFLWGCSLFFLLAWIFVLGILVGRGFLPGTVTAISDLKKQISRLQEMVNHKKTEDRVVSKKYDPDPKLAFYEKLSSKKYEAKMDSGPSGAATRVVPLQNKGERVQGLMPEKGEHLTLKPEPPNEIKEIKETLMEKRSGGEVLEKQKALAVDMPFTVQIASLRNRDKADQMIKGLIDQGYPAYYYEANVKGKIYYRIRCGRFSDRRDAAEYAKKLEREEGIKGFVSKLEW